MNRPCLATVLTIVGAATASAQAKAQVTPSFEVASIRPNKTGSSDSSIQAPGGGRYRATNVTVFQIVRSTFQVQDFQVAEAPQWFYTVRYDVEAKAADETTSPARLQEMVQTLLRDRFGLRYRRETREGRVLAIVAGKAGSNSTGHKMTPVAGECAPPPAGQCGTFRASNGRIQGYQMTMEQFAARLGRSLSQAVVDRSGITGRFDLVLEWTPDGAEGTAPTVFTAVQEQLGLRLESARGPVDTFAVERVEKPTEN